MSETTTATPTTTTEGTSTSEATTGTLLSSAETVATTEQQQGETAEATTATEEGTTTEETKLEGAPESYDFKAPEGKEYDSAVLEPFAAAAKEANLTQDAAQKILDRMAPALAVRQQEQVDAVRKGWRESSQTDKEFGGEKLNENLAVAKTAYDQFATPELKTLLETTGLGSHPEMIRLMFKIGKSISADGFVKGTPVPPKAKSTAEVLYDNTK